MALRNSILFPWLDQFGGPRRRSTNQIVVFELLRWHHDSTFSYVLVCAFSFEDGKPPESQTGKGLEGILEAVFFIFWILCIIGQLSIMCCVTACCKEVLCDESNNSKPILKIYNILKVVIVKKLENWKKGIQCVSFCPRFYILNYSHSLNNRNFSNPLNNCKLQTYHVWYLKY